MATGNPRIQLRVPEDELAQYKVLAKQAGLSFNDWVLARLREPDPGVSPPDPEPATAGTPEPAGDNLPTPDENPLTRAARLRQEAKDDWEVMGSTMRAEYGSLADYTEAVLAGS